MPPRSNSSIATPAVEPGTNTPTIPSRTPDWATTRSTPSVMSIVSPSPAVFSCSSPLCVGKEGPEPLDLVGRHRVAVLGLWVAPLAHVLRERRHAIDHRLAHVSVSLHEARGVTVVDPEQVVEHEHLAVGRRTGADPDHGDLEPWHDGLGQRRGHGLEHDREAARV